MKQKLCIFLTLCLLLNASLMPIALAESETVITLRDDCVSIQGSGASAEGTVVTISEAGVYTISGTLCQGQVLVQAGKKDEVTLILANAAITNPEGPALLIEKAGHVTLLLQDGASNRLVSGTEAAIADIQSDEEASGAALHSKADLTIDGGGDLFVGGYLHQGVRVTKDLTIRGGRIAVQSVDTAIRCKDTMEISGGMLDIVSGSDGIHAASEATDTAEADGHLLISGGALSITAAGDGLQSETTLLIDQGMLTITTGGGAANAPAHADESNWMRGGRFDMPGVQRTSAPDEASASVSSKGLKSAGDLTINGGTLLIDACDDAVCARADLLITGSVISASTGDDGLHADQYLTISGGSVTIAQSYEGIEGANITISGGDITVTARDDGINASNGTDSMMGFGMGGRGFGGGPNGRGGFGGNDPRGMRPDSAAPQEPATPDQSAAAELPLLLISGGTVTVNAHGDGLDSNGSLLITGGLVIVDGPDNSMNGALDSGAENGGFLRVTGGTVLAIGAMGMNESFDSDSEQAVLNAITSWEAGDEIVITDADGRELIRHAAARSGQSIIYSDGNLVKDDVLTITAGAASMQATVGAPSNANRWGNFGGHGRW